MPGVWALLELTDALEIRSETGNENYAKSTSVTFQALGTMIVCSPRITKNDDSFVPGWARANTLSVNSRTR